MSELTQQQVENANHIIDGYLLPRPGESTRAAFDRAKAEAAENLRQVLGFVHAIEFERFVSSRRYDSREV